ncbi:universal stress protein [Mycolicibacterium sp. 22603]|uniref:universal stress protein n=1 Tax=Mycolicibacterium sp. 22603 TaxID=3453950 RepID=UPI003F87A9C2
MNLHRGIVVGVDNSPDALLAVKWAAVEAVMHNVPLTLAHTKPNARALTWYEVSVADELERLATQHGREALDAAAAAAEGAVADRGPLTLREQVTEGNAVSTLTDLSKDAQMLVVGSRGLSRVGRAVLGSVSSALIRHAHCPVAVIHPVSDPQVQSPKAPVVVGIDGSPASETAVAVAFDEASRRGVELVAVHTWSDLQVYAYPGDEWTVFQPQAEAELSERLAGWQDRYPDVPIRRVVVRDRPAHQLLMQADGAQLVVVGSHGRGGFAGMLLGSVGCAVAESATAPVIVARSS